MIHRRIRVWVLGLALAVVFLPLPDSTNAYGDTAESSLASARNQSPRLSQVTARIGRVYDEGETRYRRGGLRVRFRLCDDGPQSSPDRFGLISITHRWGDRSLEWFLVRERVPLISWDIYFDQSECRMISWSSPTPADFPYVTTYRCYSVTVRVRDPGEQWSNTVTRHVKKCGT